MGEQTFIKAALHRRVPQILGLYLGASWVGIEFSNMIVERYALSPRLVDFLLVLLASFVPTVLMLAWFHGAPGRDEWTRVEKVGIPLNVIVSVGLLALLFQGEQLGAATTTTVTVTDEQGQRVERVMARPELRRRIGVFFLDNRTGDPELDWLQYGLAVGIANDLGQSMFVTVWTPYREFESRGFIEFRQAGYPDGLDAPIALMRSIAEKKRQAYFVTGAYDRSGDEYTLELDAYRAADAEKLFAERLSGPDLLALADQLGERLEDALELPEGDGSGQPGLADMAAQSREALRFAVLGLNAEHLDNDLPRAVAHWRQAVELDPGFAPVHMMAANANFQLGNIELAQQSLNAALQHDYRLTEDEKFIAKGMNYSLRGQHDKAVKVYEMWVELYPQNTLARKYLAAAYEQLANRPADALAQVEAVYEMDPADERTLLWMGRLHEVLDDLDAAIEVYARYADANPQDQSALIEMADALVGAGRLEAARALYERAELLDPGRVTPVIGLAEIALREGRYGDAREHLEAAEAIARIPEQQSEVVRGWIDYHDARGQPAIVLDLVDRLYDIDRAYMQPINLMMMTYVQYARAYPAADESARGVEALSRLQAGFEAPLDGLADVGFMLLWVTAGDEEKGWAYTEKVDAFLRSLNQERYYYIVELSRAQLAAMAGELEQAIAHARRAREQFLASVSVTDEAPDLRLIELALAGYLTRAGELDEAGEILADQLSRYPADPVANLRLAELEQARGRPAQAQAALAKSLKAYAEADAVFQPAIEARRLAQELGLTG
jgi:tetratricopeptide (TPR) repeat protein